MMKRVQVIGALLFVIILSWFKLDICMQGSVPVEDLSYGIFEGSIESVTDALACEEDINKKIYCKEIKQWIEPLLLAIRCLNKVREFNEIGLRARFAIIGLLINSGAIIDRNTYCSVKKIKSPKIRALITEILNNNIENEFLEISQAINEELAKETEPCSDESSEGDDFCELFPDKQPQYNSGFEILENYKED